MSTPITVQNKVRLLQEEIGQIQIENSILLNAVRAAYRKHHLSDNSIGWEELSDILFDALCQSMGLDGYQEWRDSLKGKE